MIAEVLKDCCAIFKGLEIQEWILDLQTLEDQHTNSFKSPRIMTYWFGVISQENKIPKIFIITTQIWIITVQSTLPATLSRWLPAAHNVQCVKRVIRTCIPAIFLTAVYIQKAYSNMTQEATAQWLTRSTDIIRPCSSVLCRCWMHFEASSLVAIVT